MSERSLPDETDTQPEQQMPPFAEQMAQQLGGWRGLIESSIPVLVFVLVNIVLGWFYPADQSRTPLQWAIGAAVAVAVAVAGVRLVQGRPVRFAVNGLFGIALGAWLAWDSGKEVDFYLPGIWITMGQIAALLISVWLRHPLVGWFWSIIANAGRNDWRSDDRLVRAFGWLTGLWAGVFSLKVLIQGSLWLADQGTALGITRIVMGTPLFALLVAITFAVARRVRVSGPARA